MTTIEEIRDMQSDGKTEEEIILALQRKGIPARDISEAISQSKIREAVVQGQPDEARRSQNLPPSRQSEVSKKEFGEMEASVLREEESSQTPAQNAQYEQQYNQQGYSQQVDPSQYYDIPQYSSGALSSDTITEISEQVVAEKFSIIRDELEKVINFKTNVESKMDYIDERLKRLEKIIDRLQLSILQKVGEYVTNVEDLKREVIETQKSFKSIIDKKRE